MQSLDLPELKVAIQTQLPRVVAMDTTPVPPRISYSTTVDSEQFLAVNLVLSGLVGNSEFVSLEWADESQFYMRQYGSFADVETALNPRNPDSYERDTAFRILPNKLVEGYVAIESGLGRGVYMCSQGQGSRIQMQQDHTGDESFPKKASFRFILGLY